MSGAAIHLVSVIIPCWNAQAYVGDAIESALCQTYPNVEVIVIDDGSTDDSLSVIRSFGDRVRWETGPNRGACAARNRALELARGELIQFLDADDLLFPEKLERMVPLLVEQGRGSLVFCAWEHLTEDAVLLAHGSPAGAVQDEVCWCTHNSLQTAAPLHWKTLLQEIGGFDTALPCAQERDLHLRLACWGCRFVAVPSVLLRVRRRHGSLSSDWHRVIQQHLHIVGRAYAALARAGRLTDANSSALAGLLARDARVLLGAGLAEDARRYFHEALRLHPGGGLDTAYTVPHRMAAQLVGPARFERLALLKRAAFSMFERVAHRARGCLAVRSGKSA